MKVRINGKNIFFFTTGKITLKLDSIASTFEFSAFFSPQKIEHQEIFKPLQYHDVEIFNSEDKLILTGTILNHVFDSDQYRNLVHISGYSKSGILEDVTIPPSDYPLESNQRSLLDISNRLGGLFGIKTNVFKGLANLVSGAVISPKGLKEKTDYESLKAKSKAVFGRTSAGPTETIREYLSKLCSQKNVLLSHNEKGEIVLFQPEYNQLPKFFFGKGNAIKITTSYNGQAMHSHINVVRQPSMDNEGVSTVDVAKNPLVRKYRPTTRILSSGGDVDVKQAAKNELASELKNIVTTVDLVGIFDTLYPGEIILVHNHYVYSYAYNRFMIEEITFEFDPKKETTSIRCLVPEAFTGGELVRNITFNHKDDDHHLEPKLNEPVSKYTNDKTIL